MRSKLPVRACPIVLWRIPLPCASTVLSAEEEGRENRCSLGWCLCQWHRIKPLPLDCLAPLPHIALLDLTVSPIITQLHPTWLTDPSLKFTGPGTTCLWVCTMNSSSFLVQFWLFSSSLQEENTMWSVLPHGKGTHI